MILSKHQKNASSGTDFIISEIILSNIRVLAIDQAPREKDGQNSVVGKTATLELKPAQAELLARARQTGTLSLALRSLVDANAAAPAAVPDGGIITVYRGDQTEIFSCTPLCKRDGG